MTDTKPRSVYVASASEQYVLVEHFVDRLREASILVPFEWTADLRSSGFKPDAELPELQRRYIAKMDMHAVRQADLVWVMTPTLKEHGCGMWVEMGIAIGTGKRLVVSGPLAKRTVFTDLAEASFVSHDDALRHICGATST